MKNVKLYKLAQLCLEFWEENKNLDADNFIPNHNPNNDYKHPIFTKKPAFVEYAEKIINKDTINIRASRWIDSYGNTYHNVVVYSNNSGVKIGHKEFVYGYGDHYLQTALKILQEAGIREKTNEQLSNGANKDYYDFQQDIRNNRDFYDISVKDVNRKKDMPIF